MLPWCKNKWRTLLMGPAQPWYYKMGETNLFCLHQSGPHAVRDSFCSRNRCRALALIWGHPRKKIPSFHPWQRMHTPQNWYTKLELWVTFYRRLRFAPRWVQEGGRKSSNSNLHPNPKSTDCGGFWSSPTYSTLFENYRHAQQTWLLSSTEGEKEKYKHWAELAEAIKQFKCADTFPTHRHIGGPCFHQATRSKWK